MLRLFAAAVALLAAARVANGSRLCSRNDEPRLQSIRNSLEGKTCAETTQLSVYPFSRECRKDTCTYLKREKGLNEQKCFELCVNTDGCGFFTLANVRDTIDATTSTACLLYDKCPASMPLDYVGSDIVTGSVTYGITCEAKPDPTPTPTASPTDSQPDPTPATPTDSQPGQSNDACAGAASFKACKKIKTTVDGKKKRSCYWREDATMTTKCFTPCLGVVDFTWEEYKENCKNQSTPQGCRESGCRWKRRDGRGDERGHYRCAPATPGLTTADGKLRTKCTQVKAETCCKIPGCSLRTKKKGNQYTCAGKAVLPE